MGMELVWPKRDQVQIEIPLYVPEYYLPDGTATSHVPIEMLICRKRDMKPLFTQYTHLKNFVAPTQTKSFKQENPDSNSLMILAESEEAANWIIDQQVGDILQKMG